CEEFEAYGLGAERDASLTEEHRAAAGEHAASCSRCAALRDSWQAARVELRALAEDTAAVEAPARVEMRLRQQFRAQHHVPKVRRTAVIAAWALGAAAVLVGAVSWIKWHSNPRTPALNASTSPAAVGNSAAKFGTSVANPNPVQQGSSAESPTLVAENNEMSGFTLLPGVLPVETDDAAILRVRMQRGSLGALGLPVNEDRSGEWIQVDLLVGNDGLPQAVRLPE